MFNPHMMQAFIERVRMGQKHTGECIQTIQRIGEVSQRLAQETERLSKDGNLSPQGRQAKLVDFVRGTLVPEYAKASRLARRAPAHLKARREGLKLAETDQTDVVAALGRQELRAIFRGLPADKRHQKAEQLAEHPDVAIALLEAPPMASGLDEPPPGFPDVNTLANLREAVLRRVHGPELDEIDATLDDFAAASAMAGAVRDELQEASRLMPKDFAALVDPLEFAADR